MEPKVSLMILLMATIQLLAYFGSRKKDGENSRGSQA